jgi:uncharacterized protein DUF2652/polyketide cyclase/dehydrase/lipid transport protein
VLSQPEPACLLIADISGYTSFLAGAELDHAQDVLADLVGTVVGSLRPGFRLAKLEGDAAFTYRLAESLDGPATQDTVERCYFAFRRRLRDIGTASTCDCNSCNLVPSLDLKIVIHHGPVVRQRIAGSEELIGSSVVVVHRLLKNHVIESGGPRAYALYTDAALAAMGIDDPVDAGLARHAEEFEGVGEVVGWIRDLETAWQEEIERARLVVERAGAVRTYAAALPAAPAVVWDLVTNPARRLQWQYGVTGIEEQSGAVGRRGVGTVNHCIHGKDAVVEEVVDWQPYDYVTYRSQLPVPGTRPVLDSFVLEPDGEGGTRLEMRMARPRSKKDAALLEPMLPGLDASIEQGLNQMRALIDAEAAAQRASATEAVDEPELPQSASRNIREPIHASV